MARRAPHGQTGFTLLEAIVALVIFSMGALALYSWLSANVIALARIRERQEAVALVSAALDSVRRINPMQTPRGHLKIGEVAFDWEAKPVEPSRNAVTQLGLPTIFQVGLFNVDVRITRDGKEVDRIQVRQLGYRQTAALEEE